jgi:hypothetical protein
MEILLFFILYNHAYLLYLKTILGLLLLKSIIIQLNINYFNITIDFDNNIVYIY